MEIISHTFNAMASPCCFLVQGQPELVKQACQQAEQEVRRIEKKYSRYNPTSLLTRINSDAGIKKTAIDAETAGLLNYAQQCYQQSEGLFDITSGILRNVWDFKSQQLPKQQAVDELLPFINWSKVEWQADSVYLPDKAMELDFGGFGKEYAADRAAAVFHQMGVMHGLVDLAGDIRIIGDKADQSGWAIGIRNPKQPDQAIKTLLLHQGAMTTSGNYERYMDIDGQRYCHILNPKTGWPVNHWASVTILAPQCLVAGSIATIAMLNQQDSRSWLCDMQVPHLAIDNQGHQFALDAGAAAESQRQSSPCN